MSEPLVVGSKYRVLEVERLSGWYDLRSNIEKYIIEILTGTYYRKGTFGARDFIVHARVVFLTGPWRGVKYDLTNISVKAVEKRK